MNCTRCRSVMGNTHREENPRSTLEWYDCPLCGRRELVSTPVAPPPVASRWAPMVSSVPREMLRGPG
jgi:tRNA(Ile2) C34 agmatinyltransferase TiaS